MPNGVLSRNEWSLDDPEICFLTQMGDFLSRAGIGFFIMAACATGGEFSSLECIFGENPISGRKVGSSNIEEALRRLTTGV